MDEYEFEGKPTNIFPECEEMVIEALDYIAVDSPKQAEIMISQFEETLDKLKKHPGIGRPYKNGMRKIKLGKFSYNIYYRENEDNIDILGIWHTSRGTEFEDN